MTPKPLLQSLAAAGSPQRGLGEQCGVARLSTTTPCQVRDEQFFNFLFFYSKRKLFFLTGKIFFQDTIQEREHILIGKVTFPPDGPNRIFYESSIKKTFKHLRQEELRTPNACFLNLLGTSQQRQSSAGQAVVEAQKCCLELCRSAELALQTALGLAPAEDPPQQLWDPWPHRLMFSLQQHSVHQHLQPLSLPQRVYNQYQFVVDSRAQLNLDFYWWELLQKLLCCNAVFCYFYFNFTFESMHNIIKQYFQQKYQDFSMQFHKQASPFTWASLLFNTAFPENTSIKHHRYLLTTKTVVYQTWKAGFYPCVFITRNTK